MSAVLEVESVSKTFTRTKALSGVSMTIEPVSYTHLTLPTTERV